jgi:hypothetical protein
MRRLHAGTIEPIHSTRANREGIPVRRFHFERVTISRPPVDLDIGREDASGSIRVTVALVRGRVCHGVTVKATGDYERWTRDEMMSEVKYMFANW